MVQNLVSGIGFLNHASQMLNFINLWEHGWCVPLVKCPSFPNRLSFKSKLAEERVRTRWEFFFLLFSENSNILYTSTSDWSAPLLQHPPPGSLCCIFPNIVTNSFNVQSFENPEKRYFYRFWSFCRSKITIRLQMLSRVAWWKPCDSAKFQSRIPGLVM